MKKIAFFDFDETITTADTMLEIAKFRFGRARFYLGMAILSPVLIALKLRLVKNQFAKEKFLTWFFGGVTEEQFAQTSEAFFLAKQDMLLRADAVRKINEFKSQQVPVVIVTASPSAWVRYWAAHLGAELVASELDIKKGRLTGKLKGLNCNFAEKVNRIKAVYQLDQFDEIHCFGDSQGDKEMLNMATHAYYKKF